MTQRKCAHTNYLVASEMEIRIMLEQHQEENPREVEMALQKLDELSMWAKRAIWGKPKYTRRRPSFDEEPEEAAREEA